MNSMRKVFALVLLAVAALVGCGEAEKQGITIGRGAIHLAHPAPELLPWLNANFRPAAKELTVLYWRTDYNKGMAHLGGTPTYNVIKDGKEMVPPIDRSNAGIGSRGVHEKLAPSSMGFKFVWRDGKWVEAFTADNGAIEKADTFYSPMLSYLEGWGYGKKI